MISFANKFSKCNLLVSLGREKFNNATHFFPLLLRLFSLSLVLNNLIMMWHCSFVYDTLSLLIFLGL